MKGIIAAESQMGEMVTRKDERLAALIEGMKSDLPCAENTVNYDDELLKPLGWDGRRSATPLSPPGQTRPLTIVKQGEGWVRLEWKAPIDGGKPSAYRVMRREQPRDPGPTSPRPLSARRPCAISLAPKSMSIASWR